ncbi:MAG: hypothetical protein FRX49_09237 [Trebouxia sp. A1-2]|nr:MAG: hypothetical protein FRX49_09237 [Trebouxia sp. A1-2]
MHPQGQPVRHKFVRTGGYDLTECDDSWSATKGATAHDEVASVADSRTVLGGLPDQLHLFSEKQSQRDVQTLPALEQEQRQEEERRLGGSNQGPGQRKSNGSKMAPAIALGVVSLRLLASVKGFLYTNSTHETYLIDGTRACQLGQKLQQQRVPLLIKYSASNAGSQAAVKGSDTQTDRQADERTDRSRQGIFIGKILRQAAVTVPNTFYDVQTDMQTNRQTYIWVCAQTDRQAGRQAGRQMDGRMDEQKGIGRQTADQTGSTAEHTEWQVVTQQSAKRVAEYNPLFMRLDSRISSHNICSFRTARVGKTAARKEGGTASSTIALPKKRDSRCLYLSEQQQASEALGHFLLRYGRRVQIGQQGRDQFPLPVFARGLDDADCHHVVSLVDVIVQVLFLSPTAFVSLLDGLDFDQLLAGSTDAPA